MKFTIISGSHRKTSESERIGHFVQSRIKELVPGSEIYFLSLAANPIPLWDEGAWEKTSHWDQHWAPHSKELQTSDAFIIISPEWGGMVPPGLKNLFLLCSRGELSHKPALLVGVSASINGAYPIAELRASSYKNNQICYIPEHLIVRNAAKNFLTPEPQSEEDKYLRGRLDYGIKLLKEYSLALSSVRNSGIIDNKRFPFGM